MASMNHGYSLRHQFMAVGLGAALGSLLRWLLALQFNAPAAALPLGTLIANGLGGFLVGVAVSLFEHHDENPPAVRLFCITGFLGGLTTFSTFSGEAVAGLLGDQPFDGLWVILVHLSASLLLTALGIWMTTRWLDSRRVSS
jgi:CrcB protein